MLRSSHMRRTVQRCYIHNMDIRSWLCAVACVLTLLVQCVITSENDYELRIDVESGDGSGNTVVSHYTVNRVMA